MCMSDPRDVIRGPCSIFWFGHLTLIAFWGIWSPSNLPPGCLEASLVCCHGLCNHMLTGASHVQAYSCICKSVVPYARISRASICQCKEGAKMLIYIYISSYIMSI